MAQHFIIFALWGIVLIAILRSLFPNYLPLNELLIALTLVSMLWRYKQRHSFKVLATCCYGGICGALSYWLLASGGQSA